MARSPSLPEHEETEVMARSTAVLSALLMASLIMVSIHGVCQGGEMGSQGKEPIRGAAGRVERHDSVTSRWVDARAIEVWLPPDDGMVRPRRYPVIYMHDGQGLFGTEIYPSEVDWGLIESMTRLVAEETIRAAIIVGIWNTPKRMQEYLPARPFRQAPDDVPQEKLLAEYGHPLGDRYLKFIVEELKPFIDGTYPTLPGREDTFIMGASMGGLISLSAICEYPEIFGAAACLSTHWPAVNGVLIPYLQRALPDPASHRIYFDHGTETLDAQYEPYQLQVDELLRGAGYVPGSNWVTRKFQGEEHARTAWRKRVHIPLIFLLGPSKFNSLSTPEKDQLPADE